jgi:hypothetical protein
LEENGETRSLVSKVVVPNSSYALPEDAAQALDIVRKLSQYIQQLEGFIEARHLLPVTSFPFSHPTFIAGDAFPDPVEAAEDNPVNSTDRRYFGRSSNVMLLKTVLQSQPSGLQRSHLRPQFWKVPSVSLLS